jgi:hypothetical protein
MEETMNRRDRKGKKNGAFGASNPETGIYKIDTSFFMNFEFLTYFSLIPDYEYRFFLIFLPAMLPVQYKIHQQGAELVPRSPYFSGRAGPRGVRQGGL